MLRTSAPLIGALDCIAIPTSGKGSVEFSIDFIKPLVASRQGVTGPEMVDKVGLLERALHVLASVLPWLGTQRKRAWV